MRRLTWLFIAQALLAMVLFSCTSGSSSNFFLPESQVSFINASPDSPPLDIFVEDKAEAVDLPFQAATQYIKVDSGDRDIRVFNDGKVLLQQQPNLDRDTRYTMVFLNTVDQLDSLLLEDDKQDVPANSVGVRLVNAAVNAGNVDIYLTKPADDINSLDPTLNNVPFKTASSFGQIPSGTYRLRVTPAGSKQVAYDSGPIDLPSGPLLSLVVTNTMSGAFPFSLIAVDATSPLTQVDYPDVRARVRLIHASPDLGDVEMQIDGELEVPDLTYAMSSGYLQVVGGRSSSILIQEAGGSATPIFDGATTFQGNSDSTFLVANFMSSAEVVMLEDNTQDPPAGQGLLRIFDAAPTAGTVDIYVITPGEDITTMSPSAAGVGFKGNTGYFARDAGPFEIVVTGVGSKVVLADSGAQTLDDGAISTALVLDPQVPGGTDFRVELYPDRQ